MDFNSIQAIVTRETGLPSNYLAQQLLVGVQCANDGVNRTLFAGASQPIFINIKNNQPLGRRIPGALGPLSTFSVLYASFVISNNTSYGFNKTIQNVSFNEVSNWINSNGGTVGRTMFLDYITASGKLGNIFADTNAMSQGAQAIHDNLGSKMAFEMLITQLQHGNSSASVLPAKIFLVLMKEADSTGTLLAQMQANWQQSNFWNLVADWDNINWYDTVQTYFNVNDVHFNTFNGGLTTACTKVSNVVENTRTEVYHTGVKPYYYDVDIGHTTYYGQPVLDWINSAGGPKSLGYASGIMPDNQIFTPKGKPGCLLIGTQLLTADGQWLPIEKVTAGTRLLNGRGEVSVASAEIVTNTEVEAVYGINDDEPMMSKEHAVMTQRGWCSLDPELSMSLNPHIKVSHLALGDVVWRMKADDNGNPSIALETVHNINHQYFGKGQHKTGIALNLGNGGESLWANGYCTLANFPEINAAKVAHNVKNTLSAKERAALIQGLKGASPLFDKVLGSHTLDSLLDAAENPHSQPDTGHVHPLKELSNLTMPLMLASYKDVTASPNARELSIINGQLLVNNQHTEMHTDKDHLYWTRTDEDGNAERGVLRFAANRLSAHGVVSVNGVETPAAVYTQMDYDTAYGDDNTAWYTFQTGFVQNEDGTKTHYGQLADSTNKVLNDQSVTCNFGLETDPQKGVLMTVDIEFNPTWVSWTKGQWIAATFTFTSDFTAFSGLVYQYDNTQPQNRGQKFSLKGTYNQHAALSEKREVLSSAFLAKPIEMAALDTSGQKAAAAPQLATSMAQSLTVEALFSLPTPDMGSLHKLNFETLKNLMVYSVSNDVLRWFNQDRPSVGPGMPLTQAEADLTNDNDVDNFLKNRFAMGYLSQAFGGSTDPNIQDVYAQIPTWKDKMAYFWQGSGDGCFASDKGYNLAASTIMAQNYINSVPGLQPYLQNNPKDWALQLYNYCLIPSVLSGLSNIDPQNGGLTQVNNLIMMLSALNPDKVVNTGVNDKKVTYSGALYRAILDNRMRLLRSNFTTGDDTDEMTDVLDAFLVQYFQMAQNGNPNWGGDTQQAANQNLQDALNAYNVTTIEALKEHWTDIVASMVQILNESANFPLTQRLANWADANPVKAKLFGVGMSFAVFGIATFTLVKAALNWKNLSAAQKAQVITDAAANVANVFSKIVAFKAAQVLAATAPGDQIEAAISLQDTVDGIEMTDFAEQAAVDINPTAEVQFDDPLLSTVGNNTAQSINAAGELEDGTAFWGKFSKVADTVAEGLGVLALGFACWAAGQQIKDDMDSGQPTVVIVFDVLEEVANAACFVVSGGAFIAGFFVEEVASFIPVIGAVIAIIGIIIALISLFLHRNPPPTDAENFVTNTVGPWLKQLVDAPADWLAARKNAQEHINTAPQLA